MPKVTESDAETLRQLLNWKHNVRIQGPRVRMENRPDGLTVFVGDTPAPFLVPAELAVAAKVTRSATGGGKYNGNLFNRPTSDISPDTDLSEADLGTAGQACLILNTQEVGKSTHDLASGGFLPLIFIGLLIHTNSDGMPVVLIDGDQWEDC
jgi:hypothetical protein